MTKKRRILMTISLALTCVIAVLAVLILAAPRIVSGNAVKDRILAGINTAPGINLKIDKLTLRWFAESRMEGISFANDAGVKTEIESIVFTRGLKPFAGRRMDFGEIILNRPEFIIAGRKIAAPESASAGQSSAGVEPGAGSKSAPARVLPEPERDSSAGIIQLPVDLKGSIKVRNASVTIINEGRSEPVLEQIEIDAVFKWLENPVAVNCSAIQGGGNINAALSLGGFPDRTIDPDKFKSSLQLKLNKLDLGPLSRMAGALQTVPEIDGSLSADVRVFTEGISKASLNLSIKGRDITVKASGKFRPEPLDLIDMTAELTVDGKSLEIKKAAIESPACRITAAGRLVDQGKSMPSGRITANADVNIAMLAKIVPELLKVREDMEFTGGSFTAKAVVDSDGDIMVVSGNADLKDLSGISAGRPGALTRPLSAIFNAEVSGGNVKLNELKFDSSFAGIRAAGDMNAITASFSADIAAGVAELGKFLSLGKAEAEGQLNGTISVNKLEDKESWQAVLELNGRSIAAVVAPGQRLELGSLAVNAGAALKSGAADVELQVSGTAVEFASGKVRTLEPAVNLTLKAKHSLPEDRLSIEKLELKSQTLSALLSGKIGSFKTDKDCDIEGVFTCDYARIGNILSAATAKDIKMAGKREEKLRIAGRLGLKDKAAMAAGINAAAGVSLEKLWLFGMDMRDLDFRVNMEKGIASAQVKTQFNEGKIELSPRVSVAGAAMILTLPGESRVLEGVKLTDAMVNEMLALIHPLLKNCAAAGGTVDMTIASCNVPLDQSMRRAMSITGRVDMHDVVLAPEGLIKQLIDLARLEVRNVNLENESISFSVKEGRVETSPLKLGGGSSVITLSGSVGLDGKLNYSADIPVTEKMVGADVFPYLKEAFIKIPIRGTASRPEISVAEFNQMLGRLVTEAGRNLIKEKGTEEIDRFLKDKGGKLLEGLLKKQ